MISLFLFARPFGFGGWFLGIIVVLMLVSLGLRVFMFSRRRRFFNGQGQARRRDPEQILARRFAQGEIDEEEYRRRLTALRNAGGPSA
ncbi:MAG: SHOCT domain-containing protein [Candidatus Dormiibacterota bacterium]